MDQLGLKLSPFCICYIRSCSDIAQQQYEPIYLWQSWRGQHFFHTFEKSLCGNKMDTTKLLNHMHEHCVCVQSGFVNCMWLYFQTCVRLLAVLRGIVPLGTASRKPTSEPGDLWTSCWSLLMTGGLTSVALWITAHQENLTYLNIHTIFYDS